MKHDEIHAELIGLADSLDYDTDRPSIAITLRALADRVHPVADERAAEHGWPCPLFYAGNWRPDGTASARCACRSDGTAVARLRRVRSFIEKSIDNVIDLAPELPWRNEEVVSMLRELHGVTDLNEPPDDDVPSTRLRDAIARVQEDIGVANDLDDDTTWTNGEVLDMLDEHLSILTGQPPVTPEEAPADE